MRYRLIFLLVFFYHSSLKGQCPGINRDSILGIHNARELTTAEKLTRMLDCLNRMKARGCGNDSVQAMLLRHIGYLRTDQKDYIGAIRAFHESINVITSNSGKPGINPRHLINTYFQLSTTYESLNNVVDMIKAADSCIAVSQRLNASSEIYCIRSLETRAEYDYSIGDYNRCVTDASMCELFARKYAAENAGNPHDFETGKSYALTGLGWLVEALLRLNEFKKAEKYITGNIKEYEKSQLRYAGFAYTELAQLEINKGNCDKALLLFKKALDYEKQGGSPFTIKQILNTVGHDIFFSRYHDPEKALAYYNQALRYTSQNDPGNKDYSMENAEILTRIGNLYAQQGRYSKAFNYFQQAFDMVTPGITEKEVLQMSADQIASITKLHILAGLIIDKADAFLQKYEQGKNKNRNDLREAVNIYKAADKLLVMMRATHTDLNSKLFWRSNSRRLYERAIEACYLLQDADEAFYFFEKSRAILLNEQLTLRNIMSDEDIANQVQLSKKILYLERAQNATEDSSNEYHNIQSQLFKDQQTMDMLMQRVKAKNPLYYQAVLDTSVITLPQVYHTILQDHQALLEIFSGDSAVYSLLIVPGKAVLHKIDKKLFETTADKYISFIANPRLLNGNYDGFKTIASQLCQLIFQQEQVPNGRIIISPDGKNFPFESLVVRDSAALPVYFVNDHAVSYTFSAKYLLNNFTSNTTASHGDFMGFAPVHFRQQLVSLPGGDQSLGLIAGHFDKARTMTGAEASKSNFTRLFANYSIIQVYTHAAAGSDIREPVIYFADSALYLSDLIPENKPAAKLIVLSACETGKGQMYLGEGVFNFNRGFAAYGIPSSITNLWSVESRTTYMLTELFYKYLSDHLPIDVALQLAKKEFIKTGSRQEQIPYHWAAAIIMGKTEPISFYQQETPVLYYVVMGICGVLLVGIVIYEILIRRNSRYII